MAKIVAIEKNGSPSEKIFLMLVLNVFTVFTCF